MADDTMPAESEVMFDFELPHGIDVDEHGLQPLERNMAYLSAQSTPSEKDHTSPQKENSGFDLNYRQFSPGFSDDEDSGAAFDRAWPSHQLKWQAARPAKAKKSPRRIDSESEVTDSSVKTKKPRKSLFGEGGTEIEDGQQGDVSLAPATEEHGIGVRMSSLNLEQQHKGDKAMGRAITTGFGLASSDIGSVRDSPAPSDDEFVIPPDTTSYYELRQNIDRKKAVTHVDTDKSGNFDPTQETRHNMANRSKAAKKGKQQKRKKRGKKDCAKTFVWKCIARLPFESFGNVRNHINDEQNWPDDWSEIDSEQERELELYQEHYRANTPNHEPQPRLDDPANIVDDLTGHPAARGCKSCRKHEHPCSMISGGTYPCEECSEDGTECHLIQKPTLHGRCKQCDQDNIDICSFENDPTQQYCGRCADGDYPCEALPPHGYKAQRVAVDEIVWGPDRPSTSCTTCCGLKKKCSLKTKESQPPCNRCFKSGAPCRFVDPQKPENNQQTVKSKQVLKSPAPNDAKPGTGFFTSDDLANMYRRNNTDTVMERESTPELEMEDAEGNKGMLTKITTSFAHPVKFAVDKSDPMGCNFCEIPIFGMFGHFEKEVHVIRWHSGLGYAEVGGGHAQNEGATSMCNDCTNQRLQILVCPDHKFERLPDAVSDHEALIEELTDAEPGGPDMQYQLSRWCSMCFSPALYGCNTVQPDLCGEEERDIEGCHLRLCLACEVDLRTTYQGDLDAMAAFLDSQPKISEADETLERQIEGRPRADVGFLMQNGLLMRAVSAGG